VATPRKLWETNVGLRPAIHIMSTFVCLAILLGLINLGGVILCGLGLLITIPLTYCAMTVAYMDIMNQGAPY